MTNMEQALNIFAEASTAEISKARNPKGYRQSAEIAHKGGQIAGEGCDLARGENACILSRA